MLNKFVDVFHFFFLNDIINDERERFQIWFWQIFFNYQKENRVYKIIYDEINFEFNSKKQIYSIILIEIDINSKINFQIDIDVFDLIIDFEMWNCKKIKFDIYSFIQSSSKMRNKLRFFIRNDEIWIIFFALYSF